MFWDVSAAPEAVQANTLSLNSAYKKSAGVDNIDWMHGSFFLQFAMLQKAMDCEAEALVAAFPALVAGHKVLFEGAVRVPAHFLVVLQSFFGHVPDMFRTSFWGRK